MQTGDIIMFFIGIISMVLWTGSQAYRGAPLDRYMSKRAVEKLTIPKDSILRKILIFEIKEVPKGAYTYHRVIPFIISIVICAIDLFLFVINLFVKSSVLGFWIMAIAGASCILLVFIYGFVSSIVVRFIYRS